MQIIGCDPHARQQTIAMLDTDTGELVENHDGRAVILIVGVTENSLGQRYLQAFSESSIDTGGFADLEHFVSGLKQTVLFATPARRDGHGDKYRLPRMNASTKYLTVPVLDRGLIVSVRTARESSLIPIGIEKFPYYK